MKTTLLRAAFAAALVAAPVAAQDCPFSKQKSCGGEAEARAQVVVDDQKGECDAKAKACDVVAKECATQCGDKAAAAELVVEVVQDPAEALACAEKTLASMQDELSTMRAQLASFAPKGDCSSKSDCAKECATACSTEVAKTCATKSECGSKAELVAEVAEQSCSSAKAATVASSECATKQGCPTTALKQVHGEMGVVRAHMANTRARLAVARAQSFARGIQTASADAPKAKTVADVPAAPQKKQCCPGSKKALQ